MSTRLLLRNATWPDDHLETRSGDIRIHGPLIRDVGSNLSLRHGLFSKEMEIDMKGYFVYPGLVNAHDHLEMNLYPRLGTPPYRNYREWSSDIYQPRKSPIVEIERTDIRMRLLWGALKNLVSGVTTVAHHNPWHRSFRSRNFPINVWRTEWAHSLAFDADVARKKADAGNRTFVIHAAEGIDEVASEEIHRLAQMNCLDEHTILIHGIGIGHSERQLMEKFRSKLVWCPSSNLYMFHRTADIAALKSHIELLLGSDSTLTASPTLLDEMKVAANTGLASQQEIYRMMTTTAHRVFGMPQSGIASGSLANLFITPLRDPDPIANLFLVDPGDMVGVIVNGDVRLSDPVLDLPHPRHTFSVQGRKKYTTVNVRALKDSFRKNVGESLLRANPLWSMIGT